MQQTNIQHCSLPWFKDTINPLVAPPSLSMALSPAMDIPGLFEVPDSLLLRFVVRQDRVRMCRTTAAAGLPPGRVETCWMAWMAELRPAAMVLEELALRCPCGPWVVPLWCSPPPVRLLPRGLVAGLVHRHDSIRRYWAWKKEQKYKTWHFCVLTPVA